MNPRVPFLVRVPECCCALGIGAFLLGGIAKDHLPPFVGSLPGIQFPCAFLSAVLIPYGSLLALRALLVQPAYKKRLLASHLYGLIFLIMIQAGYFGTAFSLSRIQEVTWPLPDMLPRLVSGGNAEPTEAKRIADARYAYRRYGVKIFYRSDDAQEVAYVPSIQDEAEWQAQRASDTQVNRSRAFLYNMTGMIAYLFTLYAATFAAAYGGGGLWLSLRTPREQHSPS